MGGAEELDGPDVSGLGSEASGFLRIVATAWAILWTSASGRPEILGAEEGPGSSEAVGGAGGVATGTEEPSVTTEGVSIAA